MFHNGKTDVLLRITLHEIDLPQPTTPIKTDNSAAEGIVTATVRHKISKEMDMRFYWTKDRVKKNTFSFIGNQEVKTWGITSRNITHHINTEKFVLLICI